MNMLSSHHEFFTSSTRLEADGDFQVYKTLLESTNAIPWRINWATMRFDYIGPQIEKLLGWEQQSWVSVEDWAARIHEDDRENSVNTCVAQSQAGVDHEIDYRALTKDNGYVWMRDVVHVVRNDAGEVEALVGFMFDISERKAQDEKLASLQKELEAYSFQDGLTGISNRRRFDATLEQELAHADARGEPVSLILLDIDYFKQFNDNYGHIRGDDCLRALANSLVAAARPGDLVARFGGEEFVIILPNTDQAAASAIASQIQLTIRELQIGHEFSDVSEFVTASMGIGTRTAGVAMNSLQMLDAVDQLLYLSKQNGRNGFKAKSF